jgi:hypothetical protein
MPAIVSCIERDRSLRHGAALAAVFVLVAGASHAQDAEPPRGTAGQRFSFQPVEDGIMRLDRETGQVSHCRRAGADYICRSVADDRAALEDEIVRLRRENEQLRLGQTPAPRPPHGRGGVPSDEEFDRTLSLMERFMRRMLGIVREETQKPL